MTIWKCPSCGGQVLIYSDDDPFLACMDRECNFHLEIYLEMVPKSELEIWQTVYGMLGGYIIGKLSLAEEGGDVDAIEILQDLLLRYDEFGDDARGGEDVEHQVEHQVDDQVEHQVDDQVDDVEVSVEMEAMAREESEDYHRKHGGV